MNCQIQELFDGIAYGKAAAVLHMLEAYLGEETFRAGIHSYLEEHKYGTATTEEFIDLSEQISGQDLSNFFRVWLYTPEKPTTW